MLNPMYDTSVSIGSILEYSLEDLENHFGGTIAVAVHDKLPPLLQVVAHLSVQIFGFVVEIARNVRAV